MWLLDKMAQRYRTRPSELLALEDPYVAWCFDEAVMTFVVGVEAKLEEVPTPRGKKGHEKRKKLQDDLLSKLLRMPKPKLKFRDPADMIK